MNLFGGAKIVPARCENRPDGKRCKSMAAIGSLCKPCHRLELTKKRPFNLPTKPRKPMQVKSRVNPRNPERRREAYMRDFDGGLGHDAWIRARGCTVAEWDTRVWRPRTLEICSGPIEAAHVVSRGAGGRWFQIVPICKKHHYAHHCGKLAAVASYLATRAAELAIEHLREVVRS